MTLTTCFDRYYIYTVGGTKAGTARILHT